MIGIDVVYLGIIIIMLLLMTAAIIIGFVEPYVRESKHLKYIRTKTCSDCAFCTEKKCIVYLENEIDINRPACTFYEEKRTYKPA